MNQTMPLRFAAAAAALCVSAAIAEAQDYYFGAGLGYVSAESTANANNVNSGSGTSDLGTGAVSLIGGVKFPLANGFWGIEGNGDFSMGSDTDPAGGAVCGTSATGAYLCSHDMTLRLVGLYGFNMSNGWTAFGSLGIGAVYGDFATNTTTIGSAHVSGVTYGIGLSKPVGSGSIRGEIIRDDFSNSSQSLGAAVQDSDYEATTVRLSYIHRF